MDPSTEEQISPQETLSQVRRALEDLVLFEGRQFIMPTDLPTPAVVEPGQPSGSERSPDHQTPDHQMPDRQTTVDGQTPQAPAAPRAPDDVMRGEEVSVSLGDQAAAEGTAGEGQRPAAAVDLEEYRRQICDCTQCELGHTRTNFVFGVGNPRADILFVGEAPGADEDRLGEPFVGAAGQLLTKIIQAMGLAREDVFICNVLKCRPPNNRDPLPEEVASCEPYLKEQIRMVAPKVICCLGKFASQALLRSQSSLGRLRGQQHEYEGIPLIVTYHPAALLRNAAYKKDTWEDVKWVRRLFDGTEL